MQENNKRKRIIIISLCVLTIVLAGILGTYAYFSIEIKDPIKQAAQLSTGTMVLRFDDGDNGINKSFYFNETVTKKFIVENTGDVETSISIDWENLVNTYLDNSLTYRLTFSDKEEGEHEEVIAETNMPTSDIPVKRLLASEVSVPANGTYYFNLEITLNPTDFDQTSDLEASLSTKFNIGAPSRYRYYNLRINPNGGNWKEFTGTQEYQLKNDQTMEIDNPTRVGYTFTGWNINGVAYELNGTTFSMGISDAILTAKWEVNKHTLTINRNGVEETKTVEYGGTYDLGIPPEKEGYTFTGWNITGGTIEGNSITITDDKDITVTPTYVVNNYKYIVYHKKMNVSGEGYTLVNADTDEGEAAYNTAVNPLVKTYTGFTSPIGQSLTIQVETAYPPVKNKVEYYYGRNKYALTINPNGGSYTGATTEELYYEQKKTLTDPSAPLGYNFANWTLTGDATLNGKEVTMGASASTVTANYTPKTFSVIFNANGGSVGTQSKTVTYNAKYGDLPTPTYTGYKFLGWYTSQTGGSQITNNTNVTITGNQTLFAHWERNAVTVTLYADNQPYNTSMSVVGGGRGWFENNTVKTKTITVNVGETYGTLPEISSSTYFYTDDGGWAWRFHGWYDAPSGGNQVTSSTIVAKTNNHALYAYYEYIRVCFLKGTLIYTPNGYKEIQDLKAGDKVYSYNEKTKEIEIDIIKKTMVHTADEYLRVILEDKTDIKVTKMHPFYDAINETWKPIGKFEVGDYLRDSKKNDIKIISIETIEENQTVYNFETEKHHNYFVTKDNILTHNYGSQL